MLKLEVSKRKKTFSWRAPRKPREGLPLKSLAGSVIVRGRKAAFGRSCCDQARACLCSYSGDAVAYYIDAEIHGKQRLASNEQIFVIIQISTCSEYPDRTPIPLCTEGVSPQECVHFGNVHS